MLSRIRLALLALMLPAGLAAQSPPPATTLPLKHSPRPTTAAITAADLMTRLYIFSDDSMQGREAGTIGDVKGTNYIAREIRKIGLVPAGDDGTYFQTIPLKVSGFDPASSISVAGTPLKAFADYVPLSRDNVRQSGVGVVFGGTLSDSTSRITADQARGKLVVFTAGPGTSRRGLFRSRLSMPGAVAIAVVAPDAMVRLFSRYLRRPRMYLDDGAAPSPTGTRLLLSETAAARLFATPPAELAPGAEGRSVDMDIRFDVHPAPYPARNVVGIIPGSDPKLKGEYVAIGAHNDHLGFSQAVAHDSLRIWNHVVRPEGADDGRKQATPAQQAHVDSLLADYRAHETSPVRRDSVDNGADDDGSGTVAALEIAQAIAAMPRKPKRSILFVWHVGEEKGLLGSRYYTDHPTVPRDSIVAQLNMDMVGRGDASDETARTKAGEPLHGGPNYLLLVGSRRLSTELGDLIETVNTEDHHNFHFDYSLDADGHPSNVYCRSDHYEYARYGIPIAFFTTGLHSDYHQVTDEAEYIDYTHLAHVSSLVEDVALHVADLDHRPVVDHPRPDPHGACRQ